MHKLLLMRNIIEVIVWRVLTWNRINRFGIKVLWSSFSATITWVLRTSLYLQILSSHALIGLIIILVLRYEIGMKVIGIVRRHFYWIIGLSNTGLFIVFNTHISLSDGSHCDFLHVGCTLMRLVQSWLLFTSNCSKWFRRLDMNSFFGWSPTLTWIRLFTCLIMNSWHCVIVPLRIIILSNRRNRTIFLKRLILNHWTQKLLNTFFDLSLNRLCYQLIQFRLFPSIVFTNRDILWIFRVTLFFVFS